MTKKAAKKPLARKQMKKTKGGAVVPAGSVRFIDVTGGPVLFKQPGPIQIDPNNPN